MVVLLLLVSVIPLWAYLATRLSRKPIDLNQTLGCQPIPGVEETGFLFQEQADGRPFRWTTGQAKLIVPIDRRKPPQSLEVDFEQHKPTGTLMQLFVN